MDSDGCHRTVPCTKSEPGMQGGCVHGFQWPSPCTSLGGHACSVDGRQFYISPIAPFNASTIYADGSVVTWRARERPHIVLNEKGEPAALLNGVGDPIVVDCTEDPNSSCHWVSAWPETAARQTAVRSAFLVHLGRIYGGRGATTRSLSLYRLLWSQLRPRRLICRRRAVRLGKSKDKSSCDCER